MVAMLEVHHPQVYGYRNSWPAYTAIKLLTKGGKETLVVQYPVNFGQLFLHLKSSGGNTDSHSDGWLLYKVSIRRPPLPLFYQLHLRTATPDFFRGNQLTTGTISVSKCYPLDFRFLCIVLQSPEKGLSFEDLETHHLGVFGALYPHTLQ